MAAIRCCNVEMFAVIIPAMFQLHVNLTDGLARSVKIQAISEDKSLAEWVEEAIMKKLKRSDRSRRDPVSTQRPQSGQSSYSSRTAQSAAR
jgi:hypothetical protein